jgi:hypothetical protein
MSKSALTSKAQALRKEGLTLREIAETLNVSKHTVGSWCKNIELSASAMKELERRIGDGRMKGRLIGAALNKSNREKRVQGAEKWAEEELGQMSTRDILVAGIGLYWGEGAKARTLNFTNSDPKLLVFIKSWFQEALGVKQEDFLVRVCINESHRDRYEEVQRFWVRTLQLPASQFYKPTFIKTRLKKVYENRKTYYGVISLRIRKSTDLQYRILGLIKALSNAGVAQVVRASHS